MQTMNLPTGKLRYTLTNDYLFHIVFQKNKKILKGLIKSLLNLQDEEIIDITLELESGDDYMNVMPVIHIGILNFTLFPEYPEFYAHYAMKNVNNDNIYSDKMLIHVLDLTRMDLATDEDKECGLLHWAKLFKAQTWEDIHMLVSSYKDIENIVDVMLEAMADKEVRMQCEARQRYERDQRSLYNLAIKEGHETGFKKGHSEGHEQGIKQGIKQGIEQSISNSILILQESGVPKDKVILQLMNHFQLSTEEAVTKVDSYWK